MGKTTVRDARLRRKARIRKKIKGTSDKPRLAVYRGNSNIYCQIIDDSRGITLASASSLCAEIKDKGQGYNVDLARGVGELLANRAKEKGIEQVVFDKGGYRFHGKVKALAEGARSGGLQF